MVVVGTPGVMLKYRGYMVVVGTPETRLKIERLHGGGRHSWGDVKNGEVTW